MPRAIAADMGEHYEPPSRYAWIVNATALVIFGTLIGYIVAIQAGRAAPAGGSPAANSAAATTGSAVPVLDESELRAYREILARDPKNAPAAVKAGNLLYDARRFQEAIGFYQQAFAIDGRDINVSTDLGTAFWYAGRADDALAQYDKSLALDATHAQTLFNVGIVRSDGKHDYAGAAAAWEKLLETNPNYPDAARVRSLIADARRHVQTND